MSWFEDSSWKASGWIKIPVYFGCDFNTCWTETQDG
jgi:hypothetical protein